jgi:superfamily II DNA or RNA helicase
LNGQLDGAVGKPLFCNSVPAFATFNLRPLDGIRLKEPIELLAFTPAAVVVVEVDLSGAQVADDWVEEEFNAVWKDAYPLPDAIVEEIKRIADRIEIRFQETDTAELPAAALAESPIYRGGEQLQPWQRAFVTMFLRHRELYGRVRLLLADEVGLGKTLSLAASAMVSALLDDGPVLILCPSTLTVQWQVELKDKLGIPSAVWLSNKKVWVDPNGHTIKTRGAEDVIRCPFRIAIVSTGLIFHDSEERRLLLERRFGTVVLDEAHKARRRGGMGVGKDEANNLLDFMLHIGRRSKNILLGTATPIQTEVHELWDLMRILNTGSDFVLGRELYSKWMDCATALPFVKGDSGPTDERDAWEWLRNPLPPSDEDSGIANLRLQLGIPESVFYTDKGFGSLGFFEQQMVGQTLTPGYYQEHNPILRHTVLRRRETLEEAGLLEKVAVEVHPDPQRGSDAYPGVSFDGLGLLTNYPFDRAYKAAETYTDLLKQRTKSAGFMKSLLLQRICSSFASGRSTAEKLLRREVPDDEEEVRLIASAISETSSAEATQLRTIVDELSRPEARDPKLAAVQYFLTSHRSEGKTWLEHGCIIFSQYYDTVFWVGSELAKALPGEPVAVYAGAGKSGLFRDQQFASWDRDEIKAAVRNRSIRLVVATDAACEGLNLQTLGTLINVDLPWNPSRLEQRLGRIKRFGQARRSVDMLNLVYHDTRDETVYRTLSRRLKDKFDVFGGLPDTIEDEWIESEEKLEEMMDQYIHLRKNARDVFELRYKETIDPDANRWELCSRVLSRKDVVEKLSESW